jgi:hypothetical protein
MDNKLKSTISELLIKFCLIFMPVFSKRFFKLYNLILTSYNSVTTEKLFAPIRQDLERVVEIFNQMFYPLEIITKSNILNLENTKEHLKLGIIKNGNEEEYSQIYALGADSKYGRDSMTANALFCDEHTKIPMFGEGKFGQSFLPMMNSTSGVLVAFGITSADPTCVGYNLYIRNGVKKFIASWEKVYDNKMMNSTEEGEGYKKASLNFKEMMGETSTEWLTNYVMTFDVLDGKFMSPKLIRDNNLMRTTLELPEYMNPEKFVVGGLDLSSNSDRTVLYVGESYEMMDDRWIFETKDILLYNIDRTSIDIDLIVNKTVNYCISRKLDILLVDATGMQRVVVNAIINQAHKDGCKTQIIPCDFSNSKKMDMFKYLEKCLYSQRCLLPREEYIETNKEVYIMYDEIINLIKEESDKGNSNIKYYAPKGKTDDIICAMAMANYATVFTRNMQNRRKEFEIGKHSFIPKLQKANWHLTETKNTYTPTSIWDIR